MSMTVMELMNKDNEDGYALYQKALIMHQRFGCPGKNFPCMKNYAHGKRICEGCWMNFFMTQVPDYEEAKRKDDELCAI